MKSIRNVLIGIFISGSLAASLYFLHAQETAMPVQASAISAVDRRSASDLQVMLQAVEMVPTVSADSMPCFGTFYSAQHSPASPEPWPPLPANSKQLPVWNLGDGIYLLDDRNVDYAELDAENEAVTALVSPGMKMNMMAMNLASSYACSNSVYFTNMAAISSGYGSMTASFSIAGGTNFVPYDIVMTTNLANSFSQSQWTWLGIGYTSNRYTFANQPGDAAFYALARPQKTMVVGWGNDSFAQCDVPFGLTNALQVAGGGWQSLALKTDGTVVAWGENYFGEGSVPTNLIGVTMVAAGWQYDVALLTNGTVVAWGLNIPILGYTMTSVPANLTNATLISAQAMHSLALRSDGTVVAWGYSPNGETNVPAGLSNAVAIAAGGQHNLAVKSDGAAMAWGYNNAGQCNVPAGLSNVCDVAAGWDHSLALKKDGTVVAWGDNSDGESDVPIGLSNVVAIAAGGNPDIFAAYSLALKSDGTIVVWGDDETVTSLVGVNNVIAISAGADHALAIRTGPPTPVIMLEPENECQLAGSNVTFTAQGAGLAVVSYQWQFNSVNISGATNATLTLTNAGAVQEGNYCVIVSDNYGSITSSIAIFTLVTPPVLTAWTTPTNVLTFYNSYLTFSVTAGASGQSNGFPISYQWQFDGTNISYATSCFANSSSYAFSALVSGVYSVIITNKAGSTNVSWNVTVLFPGNAWAWGENDDGESDAPAFTNILAIAAGEFHSVAVKDDGSVVQWGYDWGDVPANLTNAISVAAGYSHSIALRSDGTVETWGATNDYANFVPANLSGVKTVACGWNHNVALLTNGTVTAWGYNGASLGWHLTDVPPGLSNVTAIAANSMHSLALHADGTIAAWGYSPNGETNVPAGLSNVVAIAAGDYHNLALKADGTVMAWGYNGAGQCNVPAGLSNVMAIAAGYEHSVALKNDGTIVSWGDDSDGQTDTPALSQVKLIAAGGDHTIAGIFSPLVQYPVDVTKDVLLIYNSNSTNSIAVKNYYLAHRPMIAGANVLGVPCDVDADEFITASNCDAQIVSPILNWLTNNPTKHPEYLVLFFDMPTRIYNYNSTYPSVTLRLYDTYPGTSPFITYINGGTVTDCKAYVDKLEFIGTNYSPGKLIISASAGGYGNTNYYFELAGDAKNGVLNVNPEASVTFSNAFYENFPVFNETYSDGLAKVLSNHITTGFNIAGYCSSGAHCALAIYYTNADGLQCSCFATNGFPQWSGNSSWWIIETVESHNGKRFNEANQSNFVQWFSSIAFGGTNYSNTPVGAVCHVEEPSYSGINKESIYFGLWEAGKNFAICAWNSRQTTVFQAVGDPLITK